ncbi:hypothetical protein BSKO_12065 [Bryopsis sp. KO-2023]|nr:hypothetical protein BSKO_12065 [Bryopsis sp. KO-2023]
MAYPYPDPYGYYQPGWGAPATAPPSGGENTIQFGTFPGLTQEFPNPGMAAAGPGYPMYPVPPYPYMGPGHPGPPHPQPAPPPNHGQRPSQRKPRDEKRRPDSNHRPPAPESRNSDRREQPERHGNPSVYPPRGPPPAQAMPYGGYMAPPYGMFPYPPHPANFAPSPDYNQPMPYKVGSHRLPLDTPPQPPVPGHSAQRSSAQEAEAAQSPKSTTSNTSGVSRSRKIIPLVNPDTGQQLNHDDARQSQLGSSRQHQGGAGGGKDASSSYADILRLKPQSGSSQAGSQNGGVEPRMTNAKSEDAKAAPSRTKRVLTSEVIVSSVKQAPSLMDEAKKLDMPREKQRLPLQPPKNEDSAPANQNKQRQKSAAPVDIAPQAQPVSRKDSPPRNTPPRSTPPREGLTLMKSTVVQVAVTQTQLPTKKSVPLKTSPSKTLDKEKGDSKLVRADSAARARAPESKIPAAPTSVTKSSSPSNAASPAGSPLPEQAPPTDKIVSVEEPPQDTPAPNKDKQAEASPEPENPKVDTPEAKEATPEKAKVVVEEVSSPVAAEEEPKKPTAKIVVTEDPVADNEEVGTPEAFSSGGRLGSRDVKSPETVIVNDGEDSQEEEEKSPQESYSSEGARDARSSEASKTGGVDPAPKVEERDPSRNGSERQRQDPPPRQDSIGRRASGSLKAGVSRSASFEKGWRLQRDNSRKSTRGRGDDYDVLHKSSGCRRYTVDYMLVVREKCPEKPLGVNETSIWRDSIGSLKSRGSERSRWSGKGSFDDRERRGDRQGGPSAWRDAGRQFSGAGRQSAGRNQPRGRDMDERWGSKMSPSPFAGSGGGGLHHAEDKYVIGELRSDDPEEEKRQKKYKAVLNKLTPENFDRMFEQIIDVKVEEHKTLEGLIDQIFDKALTETTFCPLYANLCKKLMSTMPEFEIEGDKRKVTFRRLLLNKCQNEFEKGDAALRAADAVEKSGSDAPEEIEKLRVAKKERMRSLGNMQFIGHLFKEEMLTEKIIHQCIVDLLREQDTPKPEDIECLCKLVSTVGRQLKEGKQLDAYFSRIQRLTENPNLDTRHQFMLQDLIELKSRSWIARRKSEGPKKIDEIRRDAQEELQKDTRGGGRNWGAGLSSRSSNRDRGGGGGWSRAGPQSGMRGSGHAPLPNPPYEREVIEPLPKRTSIGRTNSEEISLRPASAQRPNFGRAASSRPEFSREGSGRESHRVLGRRVASPPRSERQSGSTRERTQSKPIPEEPMDPAELRRKVKGFLEEYNQVRDMGEVEHNVRELVGKGASREDIVATAIIQALDMRGTPPEERLKPLCGMMCGFLQSGILKPTHLRKGLEEALATIPDLAEDFPIVPNLFADMMEDLSVRENIPVVTLAKIILGAGQDKVAQGEDTALIDLGYGIKIFLRILKKQNESGKLPAETKDKLKELNIVNLFPSHKRDTVKVEEVLSFLDTSPEAAP